MSYEYQAFNRYFVQAADDVTDLAAAELTALGAMDVEPAYRGLHMTSSPEAMYRINHKSRLINRVLAPLTSFDCHSDRYLYKRAMEIAWEDFLTPGQTFAVFAQVANSRIKHSQYAALKLKDAIADHFREKKGKRPSVDTRDPHLWINLHIQGNKAQISVDTSGGSLHRRGYRKESVEAPMIETLAAAILTLTGWDGTTPLVDPMCGSGTLLCEAYLQASNTPAALLRQKFGFERLPDFDADLWERIRREGAEQRKPVPAGLISGSDIDPKAVAATRTNCARIDSARSIRVEQKDIFAITAIENATIVCNPPYGIRLKKKEDLGGFYKRFGDFLKQRCTGSTAYVYFGDRRYLKSIGLRPSFKKPLKNGGLDGRLAKFELY